MQEHVEQEHVITARETTSRDITYACSCECWATVETIKAPVYHTPMEQRVAEHLAEVAAIADGSVFNTLPERYDYRLFLRRRITDGLPGQVVVWACWTGGFREVKTWPWNSLGLSRAQTWCDVNPTTWIDSGFPVRPRSLTVHAYTV